MASSTVTWLIMFVVIYAAVMTLYGASTGGVDVSNTISQITGNWPTVETANCSFSAQGPTGFCSILDTGILGAIWLLASVGSILFRLGAVFILFIQLIGVLAAPTGIPIVGPVFVGFIIILALYAWSAIRA